MYKHWLLEERTEDGWIWIKSFEFARPQSFRFVLRKCEINDDRRIHPATIDESIQIQEQRASFPIVDEDGNEIGGF